MTFAIGQRVRKLKGHIIGTYVGAFGLPGGGERIVVSIQTWDPVTCNAGDPLLHIYLPEQFEAVPEAPPAAETERAPARLTPEESRRLSEEGRALRDDLRARLAAGRRDDGLIRAERAPAPKVQRREDTPEAKTFWERAEKAAAEVDTWPAHRRAGINEATERTTTPRCPSDGTDLGRKTCDCPKHAPAAAPGKDGES